MCFLPFSFFFSTSIRLSGTGITHKWGRSVRLVSLVCIVTRDQGMQQHGGVQVAAERLPSGPSNAGGAPTPQTFPATVRIESSMYHFLADGGLAEGNMYNI